MYEISYVNIETEKKYIKTVWSQKEAEDLVEKINASKKYRLTAIVNNSYLYD